MKFKNIFSFLFSFDQETVPHREGSPHRPAWRGPSRPGRHSWFWECCLDHTSEGWRGHASKSSEGRSQWGVTVRQELDLWRCRWDKANSLKKLGERPSLKDPLRRQEGSKSGKGPQESEQDSHCSSGESGPWNPNFNPLGGGKEA